MTNIESAAPHPSAPLKIGIFGAGSIGCHIAARLAATGTEVHLIGRKRVGETIAAQGLSASDYRGQRWQAKPQHVQFSTQVTSDFLQLDVILICVKSAATPEAAHSLQNLGKSTLVISLQNGLRNAEDLSTALPQCTVLAGMVPFNVVNQGQGHFHQGSQGELDIQQSPAIEKIDQAFAAAKLPFKQHPDMHAVMWSKLLLNLNNAINALSDLPLKTELSQRAYRRCLALAQTEALNLMRKANIHPAKIIAIPSWWLPKALNVPDWLFQRLGSKMLQIDPQARSSMWEDLQQGRTTEIEWLNGEIVRLAQQLQTSAPINAKLIELIRHAETGKPRRWSGPALLAELQNSLRA